MPSINFDNILRKAKAHMNSSHMQKQLQTKIDKYMLGQVSISMAKSTMGGHPPLPPDFAAAKFIEVLRNEIASHAASEGGGGFSNGSLGSTAVAALQALKHGEPYSVGNGQYKIQVWFENDLSRESLAPDKYDGVENIAALLNSGYTAGHAVYGIWKGHGDERRASLVERDGAHFIEQAIRDFMGNYASEYGVIDIEVDDVYK